MLVGWEVHFHKLLPCTIINNPLALCRTGIRVCGRRQVSESLMDTWANAIGRPQNLRWHLGPWMESKIAFGCSSRSFLLPSSSSPFFPFTLLHFNLLKLLSSSHHPYRQIYPTCFYITNLLSFSAHERTQNRILHPTSYLGSRVLLCLARY